MILSTREPDSLSRRSLVGEMPRAACAGGSPVKREKNITKQKPERKPSTNVIASVFATVPDIPLRRVQSLHASISRHVKWYSSQDTSFTLFFIECHALEFSSFLSR